jgi:hypothetical protein
MGRFTIDYSPMMRNAMREMVAYALRSYQEKKVENAHFLIVIDPDHKDVILPDYLKNSHKETLALLLQGDNPTINVGEDYFSIRYPNDLVVPFDAIMSFYDKRAEVEIVFDDSFEDEIKRKCEKYCADYERTLNNSKSKGKKSRLNNLINFSDIIKER